MKAPSSKAEPSTSLPKEAEIPPPSTTPMPSENSSPTPAVAAPITAEELVSADKDQFPAEPESPQPGDQGQHNRPEPAEAPPVPLTPEEERRGRPKLPPSGDPKLDARRERDRLRKSGKTRPPPDFSDINGRPAPAPDPSPSGGAAPSGAAPGPSASPPKPVNYTALAELAFGVTTQTAARLLGPEWLPKDDAEKKSVTGPLAVWFESKQLPDLPPGAVVILVCAAYASSRFQAPTTRQKIGGLWTWLKSKIGRKKSHGVAPQASREEKKVGPVEPEPRY